MRSIFRYPGGKTKASVQKRILAHQPGEIEEYREPFVGGGGIFFALPATKVPKRWINDRCAGLIEVYKALAERPQEFIERCRQIPPASPDDPLTIAGCREGQPLNARLKAVFEEVRLNDDCDQAFRYFFVNRTVFGGRVNYDRPSRLYFSNPSGWDIVAGDHLEQAARWLTGTKITCGDYEPLFATPGKKVWIYADPPYWRDTELTATSKLYQHSFTEADHRHLAKVVSGCKHNVCLSYDDCPFIRELYPTEKGFRIIECAWAYCGTTTAKKEQGQELLILNYDPPWVLPLHERVPVQCLQELSPEETAELARAETTIQGAFRSFLEAGPELALIRDRRLYRATHKTFEAYCRDRWGLSRPYVYKLIDAAAVREALQMSPIGDILPSTESQARELTNLRTEEGELDTEKISEVWARVVDQCQEEGVQPSARLIRAEVLAATGKDTEQAERPSPVHSLVKKVAQLSADELQEFWTALRKDYAHVFTGMQEC